MTQPEHKDKIFLAIDANAIVHRAFHAYPPTLTTSSGQQVNAVYGFTVMLLEVLKKYDPEYIMCAFDTAAPTFRHVKYTDYKATRKPMDPGLGEQFPLVEEVLKAFNIPIIKKEGFEADDILGTVVQNFNQEKWEGKALIVTGDRDLLQLIGKNVNVCLPEGNFKSIHVFNRIATKEKYGYFPEQVIDYKAIVGDPSDNIPGIKGLGEKTAVQLLDKYGTLNEIYKHLDELKPRQMNLFKEGLEQAEFSRDLATIDTNVPIKLKLQDCLMRDFRRQDVASIFRKFEFRTLIDKIPESAETLELDAQDRGQMAMFGGGETNEIKEKTVPAGRQGEEIINNDQLSINNENGEATKAEQMRFVDDDAKFEDIKNEMSTADKITLVFIDKNECIEEEILFLRIEKSNAHEDIVIHNKYWRETYSAITNRGALSRETLAYNIEEFVSRERLGFVPSPELSNIVDIRALSHVASSGRKDYDLRGLSFAFVDKVAPAKISKSDVHLVLDLVEPIYTAIKESLVKTCDQKLCNHLRDVVLNNDYITTLSLNKLPRGNAQASFSDCDTFIKAHSLIENSIANILSEMENKGLKVDYESLLALKSELQKAIDEVKVKIFDFVGHEFNINSPKQLADVLYNQLGLPMIGRGKNSMTTKEEVLVELEGSHNIISSILEYRELSKLCSTYVDAFIDICDTNRTNNISQSIWNVAEAKTLIDKHRALAHVVNEYVIKTDFKQLGTTSGRISSINPNMQNLPLLGEWARKLRKVFVARDGFDMVSIDYSQIEFRIMAHVSRDKNVMSDFLSEKDIHKAAAARIFNKEEKDVTNEERQSAKTINFAILYGQTAFGLSRQLKISQGDAAKYVAEYFNDYKGIAQYIDNAGKRAIEEGYVETMLGRRRYVIGLDSQNRNVRQAAIREAINMPIQGSAADLVKLSMIAVSNLIRKEYDGKAFMLLQIHDELVFEAESDISEEFAEKAADIMERVYKFDVPLKVHKSIGKSLADLK